MHPSALAAATFALTLLARPSVVFSSADNGPIHHQILAHATMLTTHSKEPSAPQVLTKESVDSLLNSISNQCKAEMEGALDTQWELSTACRTEIQAQLSAVPGIDANAGIVLPDAVKMNSPPGYDPNIKPPLPPKPPKLEREMRKVRPM